MEAGYVRSDRGVQRRNRLLRWTVLGAILVALTGIGYAHGALNRAGRPVPIDSLCPFGAIESLFTFVSGAGFVEKTAASSLILLVGSLGLALLYRRSFCGQLCALGALQEFFGGLGSKVFGRKRPRVPAMVDRVARWLKYVVLAVFAFWSWQAAELVMRPYDPWATWGHLTSTEVFTDFAVGLGVLAVTFAGSFVYERFFCKYLCPMGAFLAVFSKFSVFGIKRDADGCTDCGRCDKACSMNLTVSAMDVVTSPECISCNECVNACPVQGALAVKAGERSFTPALATVGIVASLALVVALTSWGGQFEWLMPSLADAVEATTVEGAAPSSSVIKGYMSLQEISDVYGIPAAEFSARFGVPEEALGEPMKEIKDTYGFSPDDVRVWVDEQLASGSR